MPWIDIILLVLIAWSMFSGLMRGMVRGVFGLVSLALAFIGAQQYGGAAAGLVEAAVGESAVSVAAGYALAFVILLAAFSVLTLLLQKIVRTADLGYLDRTGGLLFGFLRGGFFGVILVGFMALFPLQSTSAWQQSALVPVFGGVIKAATHIFAVDYKDYWQFDKDTRPRFVWRDVLSSEPDAADDSGGVQPADSVATDTNGATETGTATDTPDRTTLENVHEFADEERIVESVGRENAADVLRAFKKIKSAVNTGSLDP